MSQLRAAWLALAGYTLWVLCDVSLKLAGASRLPVLEVIASVGLTTATLVAAGAAIQGRMRNLWPRHPWFQAARAMLDLGNNVCVLIALQHVSLSMFYILIFLSPLVASVSARVLLRETLTARQSLALAAGFAGVAIAVDPFRPASQGDRIEYLACMVCVACFSANMVWSRRMTQTESATSMTFVSGLSIAVAAGVCALGHMEPIPFKMGETIAAIALFGVLGNLCFFLPLRHTTTAYVSQFHYSQLPVGALIGFALWQERPTAAMLGGAVLIIASGAYTAVSRQTTLQTKVRL